MKNPENFKLLYMNFDDNSAVTITIRTGPDLNHQEKLIYLQNMGKIFKDTKLAHVETVKFCALLYDNRRPIC
jgi:hypothetical protein